ncbi:serpin family protein [Microtetraspora sp. NBRC 13810]|uniref:serpin family protein n=1 Tax=Microtetraspora sp. NBRC 13810 TaxID=3030990 RepID=UPI00255630BF|nr:serpin family protein [Microtetraspora sp. NBRC 13810]
MLTAEGVSRQTPADAPVEEAVRGLTAFGHSLYTANAGPLANTVLSPLSVGVAYGMARAGAGASAGAELDRVFGFPAAGPHTAFNTITRRIVTIEEGTPPPPPGQETRGDGSGPPAPPVVGLAHGLFAQDGLPVKQDFLRTVTAQYGTGVHTVDFGAEAADEINAWTDRQTAGRITKLFERLPANTRLVLANALYLKADWEHPLVSGSSPGPGVFTRADGTTTRVELIGDVGARRYAEGAGWQAVELRYAGGELAMWLLLPRAGGTPGDLLTPATFAQVADGLRQTVVALAIPRWDFATDIDLGTSVLRPGADFSGIADGLTLDQAVHRANISVDEWGTEAAAVTGLAFPVSAGPSAEATFRADRPFAFAVVHTETRTPLFIGQVADPSR